MSVLLRFILFVYSYLYYVDLPNRPLYCGIWETQKANFILSIYYEE